MLKLIFCFNFVLISIECNPTKGDSENTEDFFSICPQSHSRAFQNGGKCCKERESEKVFSWNSYFCPTNEFIDCPGISQKNLNYI